MLLDAAAVKEGDLVLVAGAAGMVGGFASQLARSRGAHVSRPCATTTATRLAAWELRRW
jgi:NADPH-dependent curcumin reductase CurA